MEDQQAPHSAEREAKVVTLCGSTRFEAEFAEVNQRLTMEGCVAISLGMFSLPDLPDYDWTADPSDLKGRLGRVHFQKIRMADEVYVVDPGGYVGESTRREIAYAESLGKPIRYLSRERLARAAHDPLHAPVRANPRPARDALARSLTSMHVAPLTQEHALDICTWRYAPPYECYDMTDADPGWLLQPEAGFHALLAGDRLLGFRSFGPDGQVPGWDYDAQALDTGGALRPQLVGQGLGARAISAGLAFGRAPVRASGFPRHGGHLQRSCPPHGRGPWLPAGRSVQRSDRR